VKTKSGKGQKRGKNPSPFFYEEETATLRKGHGLVRKGPIERKNHSLYRKKKEKEKSSSNSVSLDAKTHQHHIPNPTIFFRIQLLHIEARS